MRCAPFSRSFQSSSLALLLVLVSTQWCTPLQAQTSQPQELGALSSSERQAWAEVSEALLTRLNERSKQIADLQANSLTLDSALTDSRQESDGLKIQLESSETSRKASETELTETSNLLGDSRRDYVELKQFTAEAHRADQDALEAALNSRDLWMLATAVSSGMAILLGFIALVH